MYRFAELLTQAVWSLLARISRLVCSIRSGTKMGCSGRLRFPSSHAVRWRRIRVAGQNQESFPIPLRTAPRRKRKRVAVFRFPYNERHQQHRRNRFQELPAAVHPLNLSRLQLLYRIVTCSCGQGHVRQ
jgi:hypothetical protein